jgi:Protein of unknown function (DUF3987)/Primase C terminal 2 (PriCT-2)/Bifunctional DNA primase/polymerase, N-terminal
MPGVGLSVATVSALRAELWDAGFRPIPVFNADAKVGSPGKQPLGDKWQIDARRDPPFCATSPAVPHALNTGILCDGLRPIDLDIDDPDIAHRCRALATEMLGDAPIRTRQRSPRSLMLYRAATGEPVKRAITGRGHTKDRACKIEVLGHGQQFVAFGRHHQGADLEWIPTAPGRELRDGLIAVTEDAIQAYLEACAPILDAPFPAKSNGHDREHVASEPQVDDTLRLLAWIARIPNGGAADWEDWNRIGMAIWSATKGSDFGWELFSAWSQRNKAYDATATRIRWDHYHESPPTSIGAGSLAHMAQNAGPDAAAEYPQIAPPPPIDDPGYWQSVDLDAPEIPSIDRAKTNGHDTADIPAIFDPWNALRPVRFPIESLPGRLRVFVLNRARIVGADPCAVAWAALSACSAAIDGRIRLQMKRFDKWAVPPAIWVALIGLPSTKKTAAIDAAWAPLLRLQSRDMRVHQTEMAEWKSMPKEERARIPEPRMPRRLVSHDATMEALQEILSKQDRGIGILSDELAGYIGGMEKYAGGKGGGSDRAFALQSYNGGSHVVDRVGRGTLSINNLLTTSCGGIQPDRLRQFRDITDDGLWQRYIPIIAAPGGLGEDIEDSSDDGYGDIIDRLLAVSPGARIYLSDEAHAIREDVQRRIFVMEQSEVLGSRFVGFCGKLAGVWGRLTLVLHLIVEPGSEIIREETARHASALLFRSVLPNAARVYAAMGGAGSDPESTQSIAGYILTKLLARVVVSDLTSNVRICRGRSVDDIRKLLSPLEAGGWLKPEKEFQPTAWIVSDFVHQRFADRAAKEAVRRQAVRDLFRGYDEPLERQESQE